MNITYFNIFYWSNRDIKEKWSHNMVSHLKKINSTKSEAGVISCQGETQLSVNTSEPTARGRLQQEDTWLLSKDEKRPPNMLFGAFVNLMVLKVDPQTSHTNIWILIRNTFLKSQPRYADTKSLGGQGSAIYVLPSPLVDFEACSSLRSTC